jgi:hypothetical protein
MAAKHSTPLTAERLRELLHYDPETGQFTRRGGKAVGYITERGYVRIAIDKRPHYGHRLAWLYTHGSWPTAYLEHVNGNAADNRIANLRVLKTRSRELSASRLRELLHYEPATGVFTRRIDRAGGGGGKVGEVAGYINASIGYVYICVDRRDYLAHRLAWLHVHGRWPVDQIDHINGVRSDNRLANLREATNQQNNVNRHRPRHLPRGVTAYGERFIAQIKVGPRNRYLGIFATADEAHAAYMTVANEVHGEFLPAAMPTSI